MCPPLLIYLSRSSAALEHVQNNQPLFPTLNQFTAPVAGLPQFPQTDPTQYYSPQPTAISQTLEGPAWSQPPHVGGASVNGPDFSRNDFPTIVDLELWAAGDPRAYGPRPPFSQAPNAHFETGTSTSSGMDHTGYTYATAANTLLPPALDSATMDLTDDSNMDSSSPASNEMVCASGSSRVLRKRRPRPTVESEDSSSDSSRVLGKRKTCHTPESEDNSSELARVLGDRQTCQTVESSSSSSSLPLRKRRCLHQDDDDEIKEGKFGAYRLANASAVVMTMPVHDPKPVDIRNRRIRDAHGNLLKTRKFGAMELDDSYSKRSVTIGNGLPTGMTCVRACDWRDQPCGLFVETNKVRLSHHLLHWHGVKPEGKALCKFEDCPKPGAMINLGRHIEGVHYTTALECAYCGKRNSRSDSLERHLKTCKAFLASRASAKKGGRKFSPKEPKKLVYGYIVPARNAT